MRRRVVELVGTRGNRMWVSTFHSACVRFLRAHGDRLGYKGSFTIYDDADSRRLVEIIARELDIDTKKLSPRSIVGQISQAKSRRQGRPPSARCGIISIFDRRIADVYHDLYQRRMLAAQCDGLRRPAAQARCGSSTSTRDVLAHYPGPVPPHPHRRVPGHQRRPERIGRAAGRRRPPQHRRGRRQRPVRLPSSAGPTSPISSSSSRHSPDARAITLDQNFRSTQTILDAANAVITNNDVPQAEVAVDRRRGTGDQIVRYRAEDEHDEAEWVTHEIVRLRARPGHPVGGRSDLLPDQRPEARPSRRRIGSRPRSPYKVVGGTRFYDRKEVKDVLAYLRVLVNPDDEVSWRRIVKRAQARGRRHFGGPPGRICRTAGAVLRRGGGRCGRSRRRWPGRPGTRGVGRPARHAADADGRSGPGRRGRRHGGARVGARAAIATDVDTAAAPDAEPDRR